MGLSLQGGTRARIRQMVLHIELAIAARVVDVHGDVVHVRKAGEQHDGGLLPVLERVLRAVNIVRPLELLTAASTVAMAVAASALGSVGPGAVDLRA